MSGTSMDGIDAALVEISGRPDQHDAQLRVLMTLERPYSTALKSKLSLLLDPTAQLLQPQFLSLLCQLNVDIAVEFAATANALVSQYTALHGHFQLSLIGSHGQTVYHIPCADPVRGWQTPSTLQIGDGSTIASLVEGGTPTVSQFRMADMAEGGVGAPIMPFAELFMFTNSKKMNSESSSSSSTTTSSSSSSLIDPDGALLFQNIGGMGNLTYLSSDGSHVIAFDTGPGNVLIDILVHRHKPALGISSDYDPDGAKAASGSIILPLLHHALSHPYFASPLPKATGRETFSELFLDGPFWEKSGFIQDDTPIADLLATAVELTAVSIANAYSQLLFPLVAAAARPRRAVVSGGGAFNGFMMRRLAVHCEPLGLSVTTSAELGVPADAKEAVGMAVLAYCFVHRIPSNLPSVTGAKRNVILGQLSDPFGRIKYEF